VETAASDGAAPTQTWDYSHDQADRLLQGVSSGGAQYAYGYDSADNLTSLQGAAGAVGASYNALNQISSLGSGPSFTYDANGNLTDDGVRTYNWDADNRLINIVSKADPTQVVALRYDGLGRRIAIVSAAGVETRYLWCGEQLCQARDSSDAVVRHYYPEGELIAGGAALVYGRDHLGSVRDVLAQDGSLLASYDYDAYGNPVQPAGPGGADLRYAGMFYEQNSGLYLTHYRAYDPVTARWLSRDPVAELGGMNLYAYVAGKPLEYIDPNGQNPAGALFGVGAGAFAGFLAGCANGGTIAQGIEGAAIGAIVGAVVGVVAPGAAGAIASLAVTAFESQAAGAAAYAATALAINGLGGASAAAFTNLALGNPLWNDVATGFALGALAPLLSGEALIPEALAEAWGGTGASTALAWHSAVFGILGAIGDASYAAKGESAPAPAPAPPTYQPVPWPPTYQPGYSGGSWPNIPYRY
jgi:RHS repeat-associated core domain